MRVVLQRVKSASVTVDDQVIGKVGKGYMLLVGFTTMIRSKISTTLRAKLQMLGCLPMKMVKLTCQSNRFKAQFYRYRNLLCMPQRRMATGQALGQHKSQNWPRRITTTSMKNSGHTALKFKPVSLEPTWTWHWSMTGR